MFKLRRDSSRLRDLVAEIGTMRVGRPPLLSTILDPLRELLRAERALSFGLVQDHSHLRLDFSFAAGLPLLQLRRALEALTLRPEALHFDPRAPEPRQRNVALLLAELAALTGTAPCLQTAFPDCGLVSSDQLRALVCDGEALLAWVGVFREGSFGPSEKRLLAALIGPLQERLLLDARLGCRRLLDSALQTVLDTVSAPAFIVKRPSGRVLACNRSGQVCLDADASRVTEALRAAIAGTSCGFLVTRISADGLAPWYLVIAEGGQAAPCPELASRISQWGLTPRQGDVLQRVATGKTNKAVAADLSCALKTVELHMTAILAKARCRSRSELLVQVLTSR